MVFLINPPHLLVETSAHTGTTLSDAIPERTTAQEADELLTAIPGEPPIPIAEKSAHEYFTGSQHVRSHLTLFSNGRLTGRVTLENDAVLFGFNAYIVVLLLDAQGGELDRFSSRTYSIGGKPPGRAIKRSFEIDATIPRPGLAAQVKAIEVKTYSR